MSTMENPALRVADLCSELFLFLAHFRRTAEAHGADIHEVRRKLYNIFAEQEGVAKRDPDLKRIYANAKYPLVALADDVVLQADWVGREAWAEELLEERYFDSTNAGAEFYRRLNKLGPQEDQLAEVYFLCLALGFQGSYRDRPDERRELQQGLYWRVPGRLSGSSEPLSPMAIQTNRVGSRDTFRSSHTLLVFLLLAAVLISSAIVGRVLSGRVLENSRVRNVPSLSQLLSPETKR